MIKVKLFLGLDMKSYDVHSTQAKCRYSAYTTCCALRNMTPYPRCSPYKAMDKNRVSAATAYTMHLNSITHKTALLLTNFQFVESCFNPFEELIFLFLYYICDDEFSYTGNTPNCL